MLCRLRCCLNARRPTRAFWFLPFGNVYLRVYRRLLAAPFFFPRSCEAASLLTRGLSMPVVFLYLLLLSFVPVQPQGEKSAFFLQLSE